MQVFVNEKSLHGQYTEQNIEAEIKVFLSALSMLNALEFEKQILTTKNFFYSSAINGVHLNNTLTENRSLQALFFNNIKSCKYWEDTIEHDPRSSYTHNNIDYVSYTIAEITERKLNSNLLNTFLLNFPSSIFNNHPLITVIKSPNTSQDIDCSFDEASILNWLIANNIFDPNSKYSINSQQSPRDFQTVLVNNQIFELTNFLNQGRKVYRRIGHNQLWVVDNLHYGKDAHLEVFDEATSKHLGVSAIDRVEVDVTYKIKKRTISI